MITLEGEPKSTNHLYQTTCRGGYVTTYMTPEGKQLKQDYKWETLAQWHQGILDERLAVFITFFFKTKHKRDLDNQNKIVLDALTGIVWEDDSQIDQLHLTRAYDAKNPRIEIEVETL